MITGRVLGVPANEACCRNWMGELPADTLLISVRSREGSGEKTRLNRGDCRPGLGELLGETLGEVLVEWLSSFSSFPMEARLSLLFPVSRSNRRLYSFNLWEGENASILQCNVHIQSSITVDFYASSYQCDCK
jgi:hypothetical protein